MGAAEQFLSEGTDMSERHADGVIHPVVVIGAGPACLATASELQEHGSPPVVVDAGPALPSPVESVRSCVLLGASAATTHRGRKARPALLPHPRSA